MKAVFLASAEADLKDLRGYLLRQFGRSTWLESYAKIRDAVAMIEHHPLAGRIPPELESLAIDRYRQVLSGLNRIIYEPRAADDTAYIHIVCDTRRDLKALLARRLIRAV